MRSLDAEARDLHIVTFETAATADVEQRVRLRVVYRRGPGLSTPRMPHSGRSSDGSKMRPSTGGALVNWQGSPAMNFTPFLM